MPGRKNTRAATLFYSYTHTDEVFREELEKHLSLLRREGLLSDWHDRAILPGSVWAEEIDEHLNQADLILLLVSADFLASDYCYEIEMRRALERHQRGEVHVIPVILRPCDWSNAPFAKLQALPRNTQAITTWLNQDEAFTQVAQHLRRLLIQRQQAPTQSTATAQRNREVMVQRLQKWYKEYLTASLHQAVQLELGLADKPDALYTPPALMLHDLLPAERPLPPNTSIVQVYKEAHGELLLLGEPGSGKSTLLYTLAQHLLQQAASHPGAPLPVIFSLSSWAINQDPLPKWMAEQLTNAYQVYPKHLATQWVAQGLILPLLDGLDEMAEAARPHCIQAIHAYQREQISSLVVCCRTTEYIAAAHTGEPFNLQRAVVVQPLSQEQVTTILARGGRTLAGLRAAYKQNTALQELATAPLLLNLLLLTYQGTPVRDLPTRGKALLQQVLQTYVACVVANKGDASRYPLEQTTSWLTFLAVQMRVHQLTECALEQFQPDWLPPPARRSYRWGVSLTIGLLVALLSGLISESLFGLSTGLLVALSGGINQKQIIDLVEQLHWSWKAALSGLTSGLFVGLLIALSAGLFVGLISGLISGLLVALLSGLIGGIEPKQIIERHTLAPGDGLHRSLKNGLIGGLLFGLGAWFQHVLLRFWFWHGNALPFCVLPFLADARARHLLKRVGGSYQFIHRLLLDYFADLAKQE